VYVKELRPAENLVVVGLRPDIMHRGFTARDVYWVKGKPLPDGSPVLIRTRYRQKAVPAIISSDGVDGDRIHVKLDEPVFAITPGQAAVFYDGDAVLGGAWIESVDKSH
jgi:tRNA-specific 2-thiouridylase